MKLRIAPLLALLACGAGTALAHHSYAVFDAVKVETVEGTVAKLEWSNPHVFVWVYVPKRGDPRSHDLYAFENGSPNVLEKMGWSKTMFKAGERISISYAPLRDGRMGGHWIIATLADGRTLRGAGGPAMRDIPAPAAPRAGVKQ